MTENFLIFMNRLYVFLKSTFLGCSIFTLGTQVDFGHHGQWFRFRWLAPANEGIDDLKGTWTSFKHYINCIKNCNIQPADFLFIISVTADSADPGGGSMARVSPVAVRETVFSAEICSVDFPAVQLPGTILFDDIGNIRHSSTYLHVYCRCNKFCRFVDWLEVFWKCRLFKYRRFKLFNKLKILKRCLLHAVLCVLPHKSHKSFCLCDLKSQVLIARRYLQLKLECQWTSPVLHSPSLSALLVLVRVAVAGPSVVFCRDLIIRDNVISRLGGNSQTFIICPPRHVFTATLLA